MTTLLQPCLESNAFRNAIRNAIRVLKLCHHLLDSSVAEDMATTSDGYKRVASAVEVSDRAHKTLGCLGICGCGAVSCLLVLQLCQVHGEDVPARNAHLQPKHIAT